jgi:hypothetical protein
MFGMCALTERFGAQEPKKMRPLMRVEANQSKT